MFRPAAFVIAGVVSMTSCATAPQTQEPTPEQTTYQIAATPDDVWSAVIRVFTDYNIPIDNMDKESGFIRSGEMVVRGGQQVGGIAAAEIIDCGAGMGIPHTTTGTSFISFTVLVEPEEGGTSMRVRTAARNEDQTAMGSPHRQCVSRGAFEDIVAERVKEQVR